MNSQKQSHYNFTSFPESETIDRTVIKKKKKRQTGHETEMTVD